MVAVIPEKILKSWDGKMAENWKCQNTSTIKETSRYKSGSRGILEHYFSATGCEKTHCEVSQNETI